VKEAEGWGTEMRDSRQQFLRRKVSTHAVEEGRTGEGILD